MARKTDRLAHKDNQSARYPGWQVTALSQPQLLMRVSDALTSGADADAALTPSEMQLFDRVFGRLTAIAHAAIQGKVRLMIDAEHSYFQPAIDHLALTLQRRHNQEQPQVYNTYQCYRKDACDRLVVDMERARREGWFFGAKLVRGAYMVLERERADKMGYVSPIHDSIEDTHLNYNRCVAEVLHRVAAENAEVMVATHNQASVEAATSLMGRLGIHHPESCGVFFGQLMGMMDHLTFTLGRNGYRAYKYVPFGPVGEVVPYLIRRAQENSDIMGNVGHEMRLLRRELQRRAASRLHLGGLLSGNTSTATPQTAAA